MTADLTDGARIARHGRTRFVRALWAFGVANAVVVLALAIGRIAVIARMGVGAWVGTYLLSALLGALTLCGALLLADLLARMAFRSARLARYRRHIFRVVAGLVPVAALVAVTLRSGEPPALVGMVAASPLLVVILGGRHGPEDLPGFWLGMQAVGHGIGLAGMVLILVAWWGALVPLVAGSVAVCVAFERVVSAPERYPRGVRLELAWAALLLAVGLLVGGRLLFPLIQLGVATQMA